MMGSIVMPRAVGLRAGAIPAGAGFASAASTRRPDAPDGASATGVRAGGVRHTQANVPGWRIRSQAGTRVLNCDPRSSIVPTPCPVQRMRPAALSSGGIA